MNPPKATRLEGLAIRPAVEADTPAIHGLIVDLSAYEKLRHEMVATAEDLKRALFGENPAAEAVVGEYDGAVVTFALFFTTYSTFVGKPGLWLEDLYVAPESRGRGIGKAMLCHVAKLACDRGCGRLEWSVLNWNEPALKLYRSIGAEPMDGWTPQRLSGEALEKLAEGF